MALDIQIGDTELLREVAAEFAPPSVARGLHARVADATVERGGDEADWPLVAAHYEQGERPAAAVSAYRTAAAQARRRGALTEARVHLTKALDQLRGIPAGSERDRLECGLRLERGHLAGLVDGYQRPSAAGDFERCVQLLGAHPKDNELLGALTAIISYHSVRSDMNAMAEVVEMLRGSTSVFQWRCGHEAEPTRYRFLPRPDKLPRTIADTLRPPHGRTRTPGRECRSLILRAAVSSPRTGPSASTASKYGTCGPCRSRVSTIDASAKGRAR